MAVQIKSITRFIAVFVIALPVGAGLFFLARRFYEADVLKKVVQRLEADSRVAEAVVTKTELDEKTAKVRTTIKFLEYDVAGKPLEPKYFTFYGNIIQFQALVVRFQDKLVSAGDRLKGKSAYIFLKAFVLDGANSQEFPITNAHDIPRGYKVQGLEDGYEEQLWREFWDYALNPGKRSEEGIKNAQIEAPGSLFLPGTLYTLRIEHDGGLRIDAQPIPKILRGEQLPRE